VQTATAVTVITKVPPRLAVATPVAAQELALAGLDEVSTTRSGCVASELDTPPPPPSRTVPAGHVAVAVTWAPVLVGDVEEAVAVMRCEAPGPVGPRAPVVPFVPVVPFTPWVPVDPREPWIP